MSRTAKSGPPPDPVPKPEPPKPPAWRSWLLPLGLLATMFLLFLPSILSGSTSTTPTLSYTDLVTKVDAGQVKTVEIDDKGSVSGTLTDNSQFTSQIPTALGDAALDQKLQAHNVQITGKVSSSSSSGWLTLLLILGPVVLIIAFIAWSGRAAQRSLAGGMGGFGRSKAKIIEAERPTTRFADVAGYEGVKQEVSEVVDFLRNPGRYAAAGAKGPRGVIMVGPPGTGKTLIGRAVAGEASVPFLSITGSAFVEMFVGVGASRVRDLFTEARDRAPSIIFIDEIDAVGSRRGLGHVGGNDEREQTLNQLLAEMDGFDQSSGIVVLAATNRPETLDAALLRPGRFDRQVIVPLPNQAERAAILKVHVANKHLAPEVDLDVIARGTPGFSGADLANLVNEGAINAVRDDRTLITADDLGAARDRIMLGRRDTSNALLPEEQRSVAVHESGHALVAALCEHADPVAKVTILPAGMALGATEQLPESERHLYSEAYLMDSLAVRLGGRAAELVVFDQGSTGAANDLSGATELATKMVTEFGLSHALGPIGYPASEAAYLPGAPKDVVHRYSEETQRIVDQEVARLLRDAEQRAIRMLTDHRGALDRLAAELMEHETVDGSTVLEVLRREKALLPSSR
ncbi:ATP-dependent zinc metalloprotease FtsH [Amycolatopsis alkalitolerans]|uniref:ATP-dependent zinc metalloprotease FtsH n=1 Tax=Amycolatopsis alkalitolerans TaxID=2547244 RepID=A0A5C4LSB7_9PSEU|nr:ATP-dependent zinc metalloprotease FtsH [Amycolatopsis alkalitolerans]TNC19339.1 ATP-dependent zinc metalloprotease FtsH [Amycolatopsis alkalitolerans]